jgi:hypothetical protein
MSTQDVASDLVKMWKAGQFNESGERYWADDVVSIEAMDGPMARIQGKDAVRGKGEWWANVHEVHGAEIEGPWLNGDAFTVRFTMDVTVKETGERRSLDEIGLYTIKDGRIIEESFFYGS